MTLRQEYRLGRSEFNDFLWAQIGDDANGMPLSVLSAMTRLGIDPWLEAARLAALPSDAAAMALTAMMARLPEAGLASSDPVGNSKRLVGLLPSPSIAAGMRAMTLEPVRKNYMMIGLALLALAGGVISFWIRSTPAADDQRPPPFTYTDPDSE